MGEHICLEVGFEFFKVFMGWIDLLCYTFVENGGEFIVTDEVDGRGGN